MYGLGVVRTAITYRLCRWGLAKSKILAADAPRLSDSDHLPRVGVDPIDGAEPHDAATSARAFASSIVRRS